MVINVKVGLINPSRLINHHYPQKKNVIQKQVVPLD